MRQPSMSAVFDAATAAIKALNELGYIACLCGSVACYIYGMDSRTPKDVDIIVLNATPSDCESIKSSLVSTDRHFLLVPARDPRDTYKVLWHSTYQERCKVDILTPGILNIPQVPTDRLVLLKSHSNLPLLPFIPLLFLKVQAWSHHGSSDKIRLQFKQIQDVLDIEDLVDIAVSYGDNKKDEEGWMPKEFVEIGTAFVTEYQLVNQDMRSVRRQKWAKIMD
ncbi:hypothetical protein AMATHDRAFT_149209 [Amanita thiersii Skay4041]|uniref:Uncharacterized protein n=1 Tax=Amanita thiersii Skay4041 TaxID=703135 RepID=A0A2A9NLT5_9AGAR|nr:hypothetical protein AMATHDRAFT_149209 [Amanita thiersii Skay4041]